MRHTTNYYRKEARAEEKALNWFRAAAMWCAAVDSYPVRWRRSALGKADVNKMINRKNACERSSREGNEVLK